MVWGMLGGAAFQLGMGFLASRQIRRYNKKARRRLNQQRWARVAAIDRQEKGFLQSHDAAQTRTLQTIGARGFGDSSVYRRQRERGENTYVRGRLIELLKEK